MKWAATYFALEDAVTVRERAKGDNSWKIAYNIVLLVAEHSLGWNSLCFHVNSPQPDI